MSIQQCTKQVTRNKIITKLRDVPCFSWLDASQSWWRPEFITGQPMLGLWCPNDTSSSFSLSMTLQ